MPKHSSDTPDLGMFYGDQGGPGTALPQTDAYRLCPFLDPKLGEFCTLDGAMCPFVGFNYRKCKKYINNIARGRMGIETAHTNFTPKSQPPRVEALTESKKRGRIFLWEAKKFPAYQEKNNDLIHAAISTLVQDTGLGEPSTLKDPAAQELIKDMVVTLSSGRPGKGGRIMPPPLPTKEHWKHDRRRKEVVRKQAQIAAMKQDYLNYLKGIGLEIDEGGRKDYERVANAFFAIAHALAETGYGSAADFETRHHRTKAHVDADGDLDRLFNDPTGQVQGTPSAEANIDVPGRGQVVPIGSGKKSTKKKTTAKKTKKKGTKKKSQKKATAAGRTRAPRPTMPEAPRRVVKSRHPSGFAQTGRARNYEQFVETFEQRWNRLTPQEREMFLRGEGPLSTPEGIKDWAKKLWDKNAVSDLEKLSRKLDDQMDKVKDITRRRARFEQEWEENIRKLKAAKMIDDKTLHYLRTDPQRLTKTANMMNKAMKKLYRLETKNVKVGDQQITQLIMKATLPVLDRTDYEVMRMSEQLGLAAIQKQHQYGRGYGKWNTWNLLAKQIIAPITLLLTGHAEYVQPLLRIWPQQFLDSLYFTYLKSPLPKFTPQLSRDTKFELSQKMASPGRRDRLMRGFDADLMLPPDRAVLHTRWYPTTKEPWSKRRGKALAQRYQEVKARPPGEREGWRRGFLRR